MMKRLFVINPNAGRGRALRSWKQLSLELQRREIPYDCYMTKAPGEAVAFLRELAPAYDQVVALGGDGTVHEVVNGIFGTGAKLGIIPAGTGNDFARFLNWSPEPEKTVQAVERIIRNESVPIDLVRMKECVFINVAGMGFDAAVAHDMNQSRVLKKLGAAGYIVSVFKNLPVFEPRSVVLEIDGKQHRFEKTWLIAVGNATSYGGGMRILPKADYQDGLLDICVVSNISRLEIMRVFPQVFSGRHVSHPAVRIFRGKHVRVETKEPFNIQADGEIIQREYRDDSQDVRTGETFDILPQSIRLLI